MRRSLGKIAVSIKCSIIIFIIFVVTVFVSGSLMHIAIAIKLIPEGILVNYRYILGVTLISCIIIGTSISILASRSAVKTFENLIKALNQLANGDFSVRLEVKGGRDVQCVARNFNHMAKELGSIEVLRNDFINNFSHEFKTPIVSIKGFAEILKHDDLTVKEREEYLDIVIEEASRLATLANNVLAVSKIEQQGILTNKQSFNLGEQIRQCIILLDAKLNEKSIELELNLEDVMILGNKDMMSQVWVNLLDNAIKFSHNKGMLSIMMQENDKNVEVQIKDTGCGIDKEVLPKIFDKFYQGDTSHKAHGNGLGLSLVKKIVDLHGGSIACESKVKYGTTFKIILPK